MFETRVEVHILGVLIGFFIGYLAMYVARPNVENGYELFAIFVLGLLLLGAWFSGVYYALERNRND
jgi:hypothetical protein